MNTKIRCLAATWVAATLLGGAPQEPKDADAAWQQAYVALVKAKERRNKSESGFLEAIADLGKATYPKRDQQTAQSILGILFEELKDDTADGSKEHKIDHRVIEACETALRKVTHKSAVDLLIGHARNGKTNLRVRFSLCQVIGGQPDAFKVLVDMLQENDPRLQIGAADGLKEQLKTRLTKKVDDLAAQVTKTSEQAGAVLSAVGAALEGQPAALFKTRGEALPVLLEGYSTGFSAKGEIVQSMEEMLGIVNAMEGEEARGKVVPLVTALKESVDKLVKSAEELDAARKEAEPAVTSLLNIVAEPKRSWEVRISALQALRTDRHASHVDKLMVALEFCGPTDGRLKVDLMNALAAIVGIKDPKTDDPGWWKSALAERRAGKRPGESGGTVVTPTEFFGLKTKSTRIVFILDQTGSMAFKCTVDIPKREEPPRRGPDTPTGDEKIASSEEPLRKKAGEIKKKWDDRKIEKRMDALKREFINTIYYLDPRVIFGLVVYEMDPKNWKPSLVQATWANKFECITFVDRLDSNGGTNIWGGLENAFRFVAEPHRPDVVQFDKRGNYVTTINGADTFFLMTDGNHNQGRFSIQPPPPPYGDCDERAFLTEFKKINAVRRVVVNTIILGDMSPDDENKDPIKQKSLSLMRSIAESSGGAFVHLGK
jgi:hypothetical protein